MRHDLSASDLARLRRALELKRDALRAAQGASREPQRAIGDPESELGDAAERVVEQDAALRLASFDQTMLEEVERALAKLDAGTYGVSEDSGAPISLARLEAVPWARRTAEEELRRARR